MKTLRLNTRVFLVMLLFLSAFLKFNNASAQSTPTISGEVSNLEVCGSYPYSTNFVAPAGATNVNYDWNVSSGADYIDTPANFGTFIRWKNAPDSNTPKVVRCKITYYAKDATSLTTVNATPRTVTVKYFSAPSAITINGSTANPYSLTCGTSTVTLSVGII